MAEDTKYTHIGIEKTTQRKIAILAPITGKKIYELVAGWAEAAWESAKATGQVNDRMLGLSGDELPVSQLLLPEVVEGVQA